MKKILFLLTAGLLVFATSCKTKGSPEATEPASAEAVTAPAPAFQPFKLLMVRNAVKDYPKWKAVYLSKDSLRTAYGLSKLMLGRSIPDSNSIIIFDKLTDLGQAKEFIASSSLKEAMKSAGTASTPKFDFIEVIRNDDSQIDTKDRIMIIHKVKDFDAWLKVFDAESKDTRAQFGMVDRGLGRGLTDPNLVYIVFAVTDMAKAKARGESPELKKLMEEAGVVGPPTMISYQVDMIAE